MAAKKKSKKDVNKRRNWWWLALLMFVIALYLSSTVDEVDIQGENWALLVGGSWGYVNYRHEDSNIIVFMSGDASFHGNNPKTGELINSLKGVDVYKGVPQDYIGADANTNNLVAVLLGDKSKVIGGSGKVMRSASKDRVFFFYTDHGNDKHLQMPSPRLSGAFTKAELGAVLAQKHASGGYKSMVIYMNACRAGNIMQFISNKLDIYVLTSGAEGEDSRPTYCPVGYNRPPPFAPSEYSACLASEFGAAWMEHSEQIDTTRITLQEQYRVVKERVISSNVTQHGRLDLAKQKLSLYIGPIQR